VGKKNQKLTPRDRVLGLGFIPSKKSLLMMPWWVLGDSGLNREQIGLHFGFGMATHPGPNP